MPLSLPMRAHSCLPCDPRPGRGLLQEMILTCPSCGTQYVVKDGAIPPEGRQVRCASCKHSWHQNPESSEPSADDSAAAAPPAPEAAAVEPEPDAQDQDESLAEATLIEPRSG